MEVDRIFENIRRDIQSDIDGLTEFRNWIQSRQNELTENEGDIHKGAILSSYVDADISDDQNVQALLELRRDLETAYREPITTAIEHRIFDIIEKVNADISDDAQHIKDNAINRYDDDLSQLLEELNALLDTIQESPEVVKEIFGNILEDTPLILAEPENRAREVLTDIEHNYSALSAVTGVLSGYPWSPTERLPLHTNPEHYPEGLVDQKSILEELEKISRVNQECGKLNISISRALRGTISKYLESGLDLHEVFSTTSTEWQRLTEELDVFEDAIEILSKTDSAEYGLDNLRQHVDSIQADEYSSNEEFQSDMYDFEDEFQDWLSNLSDFASDRENMLENIQARLEVSVPDELEHEQSYQELVEEDPSNLIEFLLASQEWIDDQLEEYRQHLSEDALKIFQELLQGDPVPLEKCENDVIDELRGIVPINLIIHE